MAIERRGHTVARPVDVDDLARFGKAVGREQVVVARRGVFEHLGSIHAVGHVPVAEHLVVLAEAFKKPHLRERHAAAERHALSVDLRVQIVRRFLRRREGGYLEAALFEILLHRRKIHSCFLLVS